MPRPIHRNFDQPMDQAGERIGFAQRKNVFHHQRAVLFQEPHLEPPQRATRTSVGQHRVMRACQCGDVAVFVPAVVVATGDFKTILCDF